ncbi:unnamed protein product [Calypogeia fissa]
MAPKSRVPVLWALVFMPMLIIFIQHQHSASAVRWMAEKDHEAGLAPLTFVEAPHDVTLGNDKIQITLGKGGLKGLRGSIRSLVYQPLDGSDKLQLLQDTNYGDGKDKFPGYWDMHWYDGFSPSQSVNHNSKCSFGQATRTILTEARSDEGFKDEMLGVTYKQEMKGQDGSRKSTPLNTMVHYSVRKDVSGIYCTLLLDHTRFDPAMLLTELRLVLMLNPKLFDYSYIADDRQRFMHTRKDISKHASSRLAFKEARILTNPENTSHYGEVDHKYMHSVETKDSMLYGWISTKLGIGVWVISPNKWEYLGGGPTKQELSVQTGPKLLAMLHSRHYGTPLIDLDDGEEWKKVFGPFLVYVNEGNSISDMISDAKARAAKEAQAWPYKWVPFPEYTTREDRGLVVGRLVRDLKPSSKLNETKTGLAGMWVGLTDESSSTSNWELEVKNYQYWNTTDEDGEFAIYSVRPGKYVLQTVTHGFLVDSSVLQVVTVKENWVSNVGNIMLRAVQKGQIVWEIGYPDRLAAEFMVPSEANPETSSRLDAFRQYGLWQKYWELFPARDPVFVVGESDWTKDWYFAHVLRPNLRTSTREIRFTLPDVVYGDYTLRIAIAGAHQAALEIRVNNRDGSPLFDTGPFGKDNALARAGLHGHYYEFSVSLSHMNFREGQNSIFLRQRRAESRFNYVMYDYLRLEAPAATALHQRM